MSACFSINDQLLCCGSEAWVVSHYFRLMLQEEIPKDSNTDLNYVYTDEERKNGYSHAFSGNISYEDLHLYETKINKFIVQHSLEMNVSKVKDLVDYIDKLTAEHLEHPTIEDVVMLKSECNAALYTPEPNDLFSNHMTYDSEFWEFVESLDDTLRHILKYYKCPTYYISFNY